MQNLLESKIKIAILFMGEGIRMSQKIVIIGGGVAGLTAGIYAQKAGFESEIYEKHTVMGGLCTGWKRKGFYIDNCITWMTCAAPKFPIYKMYKEVGFFADVNGNEIACRQHDAFYTSELDGQKVTLWCDLERAQKEMIELSPQDKKWIKRLFKYVRLCMHLHAPFKVPIDMMNFFELAELGIPNIPVGLAIFKYRKTSLADFAEKFKHPLLKKMLTDYLPKNYLAYFFISAYATLASGGGGVPDGGSSKAIERMEEIYKSKGGKIFTNSPVEKVEIENGHCSVIVLENGQKVSGDFIIPTCDPHYLFEKLLDEKYMPAALKAAYKDSIANELGSSFQVAYEYDGETNEIGRRTYFDCSGFDLAGEHRTRLNMKNYSLDPISAPKGKNLIQVKILQSEKNCLYWESLYKNDKAEYDRQKQNAADDILKLLEERVPSAKGKMKVLDIWTPYTYTRYTNAYRGVYMSFIVTKKSKNLFNIPATLKGIDNVFLAGQWLCMPGGLPMAMSSGKFAVQRILRSLGKNYRIEP